ncbi:MarR family transcriptional regulator [Gordonia sp. NPDC003425]
MDSQDSQDGDRAGGNDFVPWPSALYRDLADELLRMARRRDLIAPGSVLERSAFNLLWILSDGRPRTLRELSELTHLEQSTINRQVNAAITHGYLERFDVAGSTSRRIRPTQRGVEAFEHDGLLRARRLERVLSDMAPGTPEALLRELHAFNEAYDRLDEPDRNLRDRALREGDLRDARAARSGRA